MTNITTTGTDLPADFDPATFANAGVSEDTQVGIPPNPKTTSVTVGIEEKKAEEVPEVPAMPENGNVKYYNPKTGEYDWQSHSKELEFKLQMAKGKAAKREPKTPVKEQENLEGQDTPVSEAQAKTAVAEAGLDWEELGAKVSNLGDIDPEDYEALEKAGIPRPIIEAHIQGLNALKENTKAQLYAKTGGPEGTEALLNWAKDNLNPKEIDAYNDMLSGPQWPVAIDALIARSGFRAPNKPTLVRSGQSSASVGDVYKSEDELQADIANPKYSTDASYRMGVVEKLRRTYANRPTNPQSSIGSFAGFNVGI